MQNSSLVLDHVGFGTSYDLGMGIGFAILSVIGEVLLWRKVLPHLLYIPGGFGNFLTILVISRNNHLHNHMTPLLLNLAFGIINVLHFLWQRKQYLSLHLPENWCQWESAMCLFQATWFAAPSCSPLWPTTPWPPCPTSHCLTSAPPSRSRSTLFAATRFVGLQFNSFFLAPTELKKR